MERAVEDDHCGPAGRSARDLDRVLDRLCAGVDEHRPLRFACTRRELGELPAHLDVGLVHPDHEALVEVAVDLLVDGRDRGREAVTRVLAADAPCEVDELAPVDVPHPCALGAVDDERRGRDPARDEAFARGDDPLAGPHLLQRHGAIHPMNRACGQVPMGRNRNGCFGRPVQASWPQLAEGRLAITGGQA